MAGLKVVTANEVAAPMAVVLLYLLDEFTVDPVTFPTEASKTSPELAVLSFLSNITCMFCPAVLLKGVFKMIVFQPNAEKVTEPLYTVVYPVIA